MRTSFTEWMSAREANNDVTTSYVGRTPNSSEMGFAVDQEPPVRNPSLPHQMNAFRSWYDYHRGRWSEVEKAARQNPAIKQFLHQAATQLINQRPQQLQKNPYGDSDEFDIEEPTVTGNLGDQLEKLVKATLPTHGYEQDWEVPQQYASRAQKQVPPAYKSSNQQAPQTPMGADSTQLITHLWHRQDRLEKKVDDLARGSLRSVA